MDEDFINKGVEIVDKNKKNITLFIDNVNKPDLPRYWSKEYINEHIDKIKNHKHKMLCRFLWYTGVRITESISITKRDIDFGAYLINIRWQKSKKYANRNIPIHPVLRDILQVYTAPMNMEDRVFPMTRQNAYRVIRKNMNGHPHQFRHSFAVNWIKCGGDVTQLSKMLGHKHIQYTMVYLNIVPMDVGKELLKIMF